MYPLGAMVDPGVLLIGGAGLSASAALVASARTWRPREYVLPSVYTPELLGLERLPPRGVLVQYSSPYSSACRVSLNRLAAAVAPHRDEAVVIEMHALSAGVRTVPTVLFIDPQGRVKRLWLRPPERAELSELLAPTTRRTTARCSPAAAR
ncbi:MAG: hypothetical protein QOJ31_592 [Gaiellales bacterium]|nr:hypothetical protein [Gaiellales bacterium]MDX6549908.1 hypothetical protein [Gaiellales bacterium]